MDERYEKRLLEIIEEERREGREIDREQAEKLLQEELDAEFDYPHEVLTCFNCSKNKECKYAWDPFNTDGDCLMDK